MLRDVVNTLEQGAGGFRRELRLQTSDKGEKGRQAKVGRARARIGVLRSLNIFRLRKDRDEKVESLVKGSFWTETGSRIHSCFCRIRRRRVHQDF